MHTMVFVVCFRVADGVLSVSDYCGRDRQPPFAVRSCIQLVPAYQRSTRTRVPAFNSYPRSTRTCVQLVLAYQRTSGQLGRSILFQIPLLAVSAARGRVAATVFEWVFRRYWANFVLIRRSLVLQVKRSLQLARMAWYLLTPLSSAGWLTFCCCCFSPNMSKRTRVH